MKKIIGYALIVLFIASFWVGLSIMFYSSGISLPWSIAIPFLCYIVAVLLIGLAELVTWLLN